MLEIVNDVVGVDFPQQLDVKGGDHVIEFKLVRNLERWLKLSRSSIFQVGGKCKLVVGTPYAKFKF